MKAINEFKMTVPARSRNEAFARTAIAAFAAQLDPTVDQICDLKTAVSEAITNCVVHAYPDEMGLIYISARLFDDGRISIKIRDRGCGIPDISQAMEPLYTTGGEERAGLGFAVMQSFTDKLRVTSRVGKGTCVTMEKMLRVKGEKNQSDE